ncbi:MAG: glycosyltransferase family 9 protein [Acidobacteriota bacterium]
MFALLDRIPEGSHIAVIRLRSLGDCVLTTPALVLLKQHRPDLQIGLVVEDRFTGVFEGLDEVARTLQPDAYAIARWEPQLLLNLHGGSRSMWLTAMSGAREKVGFAHHAYNFVYNAKIPRAQEILGQERPVHTAEHLASAMFWLGVPISEIPRAKLFTPPRAKAPDRAYSVIHPYASAPEKAWGATRFKAIAHYLREQAGLKPIVLAGPGDSTDEFQDFEVLQNAPLTEVKSVIAGAQLFVGNDSGPAHIAAAFGIPVTVLFGASNPVTWAPWRTEAQVLTSPTGMADIEVNQVLAAVETLRVRA